MFLTVAVSCVNPTRKPVVDAARSSARPVVSSIRRSIRSLLMGNVECTNPEKNKLVIHGTRFKMFFKTAQAEVPAELGKPGPRNSPLMLGAEEFQIEFGIGQLLEISLKQFIDILNTCVFIRADIESRLSKNVAVATT